MSREILFRAKRIDNGHSGWVEGNLIYTSDNDDDFKYIIIPQNDSGMFTKMPDLGIEKWYKIDPSTVCQYTGLTGRNGEKLWEGDIVKWFDDIPMRTMYAQIAYADGAFVREYEGKVGTARLFINERSAKELEVIGNILDNPELLKGGKDGGVGDEERK